jgi:hypothetical protein
MNFVIQFAMEISGILRFLHRFLTDTAPYSVQEIYLSFR